MSIFTYALASNNKVYLSTDKGLSWTERATLSVIRQKEIYADPNYLTKVWVGGGSDSNTAPGTLSTDAALTFSQVGWPAINGRFLQYQTINSSTVYAAGFGSVAKSTNGGVNFNPTVDVGTVYPGSTYVYSIYFYTSDFGFAGIGSPSLGSKLFKTLDGCASWTEVTSITFTGNTDEDILGISGTNDGRYLIVTTTYGVYISDDGLNNWIYTAFPNTGRSNIYKLSETEYFVAFYSDGNTSSFFYTTSDRGLTWNAIPFTGTTPDLTESYAVDVYMYNSLEGHISISGDPLLYTSNGGVSFTPSSLGRDVNAFTVTERICDECPDGYTKDGDNCVLTITYPATYSLPEFVTVVTGSQQTSYGKFGLNLMRPIITGSLPLLGGGPGQNSNIDFRIKGANGTGALALVEPNYGPTVFSQPSPIVNTLWKNRLNTVGIWVNGDVDPCNPNTSPTPCVPVSFSWCVNPTASKTYLIGIAGDNEVRFKVDGLTYVRLTGQTGAVTAPFNYWHVFPVQLTAGQHTITLEGYNFAIGAAALGAEIYDITVAEFKTLFCDAPNPTPAQLEPYIIFSTKDTIGTSLPDPDQEDYPGVWTCPDGSEPSNCFSTPVCTIVQTIPFVKCYYELVSCLNSETVIYTSTDVSAYTDMSIKLDDDSCWTVVGLTDFYVDPVEVTVVQAYDECVYCLPSYKLLNCKDNETTIYTGTDFSAYINPSKIIKVEQYPNECWQVVANDKATFIPQNLTADGDPFTRCIDCNPTIYQLDNCFNDNNFILSDSDLAAVQGKVISIVGYPGLCFSVGTLKCECVKITGNLGAGQFTLEAQATGILIGDRNQYNFTNGGNDYFLNWNMTQSRWEINNLTAGLVMGYSPLDIDCPYTAYWEGLPGFVVESCATTLYDITIDKIYPDCECCITKSCN